MLHTKHMLIIGIMNLVSCFIFPNFLNAQELNLDPLPGMEIQTHGPVHQAFIQPFELQPEPGDPVPKEPPPPIPEVPPAEAPAGDNVQWIPGYWAWDAETHNFIWISGTYRNAPPDREYVPGYWTQTSEGWRWVAGYWAPGNSSAVQYTPEPPAPLETGPSLPAPNDDSVYISGYWSYGDNRFAWRPGFWTTAYANRIWISPFYLWTPAGYVFVNGYWDYPLENRGLLFAPVCFHRPLWQTSGWYYQPNYVVGGGYSPGGWLLDYLFCRGRTPHYYFGNYFGPQNAGLGFRPWYTASYNPHLGYYRWSHRSDPGWYGGLQQRYAARSAGTLPVPPRTWAQQSLVLQSNPGIRNNHNTVPMVTNLNKVNINLTRLTPTQLNAQRQALQRSRTVVQQRQRQEIPSRLGNRSVPITVQAGNNSPTINIHPNTVVNSQAKVSIPRVQEPPPLINPGQSRQVHSGIPSLPNHGTGTVKINPTLPIPSSRVTPPVTPRVSTGNETHPAPRVVGPAPAHKTITTPPVVHHGSGVQKSQPTPAPKVISSPPVDRSISHSPAASQANRVIPSPSVHKANPTVPVVQKSSPAPRAQQVPTSPASSFPSVHRPSSSPHPAAQTNSAPVNQHQTPTNQRLSGGNSSKDRKK